MENNLGNQIVRRKMENGRREMTMFERLSAVRIKLAGKKWKLGKRVLVTGVVVTLFVLYAKSDYTKSIPSKWVSFIRQEIPEQTQGEWKEGEWNRLLDGEGYSFCQSESWSMWEKFTKEAENGRISEMELKMERKLRGEEKIGLRTEEWYETDRKLTDAEWNAMTHMILSEARGESFEVQYYIACVVLNRVDSDSFPDTVEAVLYQTDPVQFQGAWDPNRYEPTGGVLEAIQAALEDNRTPSNMYYFTSEGWLFGTKAWKQVGGMWFSCQE